MSHSPSRYQIDKEMRRREAEASAIRAEHWKAAQDYAARIVRLYNARAETRWPSFYPTIGTAIIAGTPILRFFCPACQQMGETDLRQWDRHANGAISSLIPDLSCDRCCPNPPLARLRGLAPAATMPVLIRQKGRR
jgi:hypothetical protein